MALADHLAAILEIGRGLMRATVRARRPVSQVCHAAVAIAAQPAVHGLAAHPEALGHLGVVRVGRDGRVSLYNYAGTTHVVVDVAGWYA